MTSTLTACYNQLLLNIIMENFGNKIPIVTYPHPALRQKGVNIDNVKNADIQQLIADMKITMVEAKGIGLAAPQVNQLLNLFIAQIDQDKIEVFINPSIIWRSNKQTPLEEGCLSLPGISAIVQRPEKVIVTYLNEKGQRKIRKADGLLAKVIQHEFDHLNGILIIDKAVQITQGKELIKKLDVN